MKDHSKLPVGVEGRGHKHRVHFKYVYWLSVDCSVEPWVSLSCWCNNYRFLIDGQLSKSPSIRYYDHMFIPQFQTEDFLITIWMSIYSRCIDHVEMILFLVVEKDPHVIEG